mmetsp:Transcript_33467/g.77116  ORF Transcript_33467/g.77116 Transcript_33467/m.77116 type:complete len:177 (+) Transcript_33467:65-595(+)
MMQTSSNTRRRMDRYSIEEDTKTESKEESNLLSTSVCSDSENMSIWLDGSEFLRCIDDDDDTDASNDGMDARNRMLDNLERNLLRCEALQNKENENVCTMIAAVNEFVQAKKQEPMPGRCSRSSRRLDLWNDEDSVKYYLRRESRQESNRRSKHADPERSPIGHVPDFVQFQAMAA